jgi:hypothetical protein
MLDGIMLLWFVLAAASVLFVAIDIRTTPESSVMKWGCASQRLHRRPGRFSLRPRLPGAAAGYT